MIEGGAGAAATKFEQKKINKYSDLNFAIYEFLPMIFESSGGVGNMALKFAVELEKRRTEKLCSTAAGSSERNSQPNRLLTAINVSVQRSNAEMILAREPAQDYFLTEKLVEVDLAVASERRKAIDQLKADLEERPERISSFDEHDEQNDLHKKPKPRVKRKKPPLRHIPKPISKPPQPHNFSTVVNSPLSSGNTGVPVSTAVATRSNLQNQVNESGVSGMVQGVDEIDIASAMELGGDDSGEDDPGDEGRVPQSGISGKLRI